jgi:hypothetical protein
MNEHAGPACALSGLIVGIFAVLLHDTSPPPAIPKPNAHDVPAASSPSGGGTSKPDAPAAIQQASPTPAEKASVAVPAVVAPPIQVAVSQRPRPPEPAPRAKPAKAAAPPKAPKKRPPPPSPRPSFAIVEQGESLADVAARVYGSEDAAEALWKANRDQVERVDSPLARGTLLRTP